MAHVTSHTSTLPGHKVGTPEGTMCDKHSDRPAVSRFMRSVAIVSAGNWKDGQMKNAGEKKDNERRHI